MARHKQFQKAVSQAPRSLLLILIAFVLLSMWFFIGGSPETGKLQQSEIRLGEKDEQLGGLNPAFKNDNKLTTDGGAGDDKLKTVDDKSKTTKPEPKAVEHEDNAEIKTVDDVKEEENKTVEVEEADAERKKVDDVRDQEDNKPKTVEQEADADTKTVDNVKVEEVDKPKTVVKEADKDEEDEDGKTKTEVQQVKKNEDDKSNTEVKQVEKNEEKNEEGKVEDTVTTFAWKVCSTQDYIPCLDNEEAMKMLPSRSHFEHRERHCPQHEDLVSCLVPLPNNYRRPIPWPKSRDEIWYDNVPHPQLISYKKDQGWVKKSGDRLVFPGHGTQFVKGADHYIEYIQRTLPDIDWGKHTRVVLDVGCGVASFGGYVFKKDVITMSFAPKDEHEAQIQLALERGIPAISSVMGTQRLVFPANVFDMAHCARCRVPWHVDGGRLLLEINRVLRPGGYFVWSAPPVYRKQADQVAIWKNTSSLAASMCWNQLARTFDSSSGVGVVVFQKPRDNSCYERRRTKKPVLCEEQDKRDAAWYIPMKDCVHKVPVTEQEHGSSWPEEWPKRLEAPPSWLRNDTKGIYGEPLYQEFVLDTQHWQHVVQNSYLKMKLDWKNIRNVMDMKAAYGGFAAALISKPVWVMNVVPIYEPDTLPIIFDRGLLGIYHDWCESFSTYPRTYDLVHADHLLTKLTARCNVTHTLVELDRIVRPEGYVIFRDKVDSLKQLKPVMESLKWDTLVTHKQGLEELLVVQKQWWRP